MSSIQRMMFPRSVLRFILGLSYPPRRKFAERVRGVQHEPSLKASILSSPYQTAARRQVCGTLLTPATRDISGRGDSGVVCDRLFDDGALKL